MQPLKDLINWLAAPEILISISIIAFFAVFAQRKLFARGITYVGFIVGLFAFLTASAGNASFREILLKPDNVPIILLVVFVSFFFWLSMRQAVENDKRTAEGKVPLEIAEDPKMVYVWPHLVYTEFI